MDKKGNDRRSQRTQQSLMEALVSLLNEKPYDEISINEICDRANVGRSTFYAHFQTKDDLLKCGFERVLDVLISGISFEESGHDLLLNTQSLFRHATLHYQIYRTLVWGTGFDVLTKEGHAALSAKFQESFTHFMKGKPDPSIPLDILSYSLSGTLLQLLKWWLDHKMPYSSEAMDEMFQKIAMPGVRLVLGSENPTEE